MTTDLLILLILLLVLEAFCFAFLRVVGRR